MNLIFATFWSLRKRSNAKCILISTALKLVACEQTLRGALAAGREKERELATLQVRLRNLNSTSNSPVAPRRLSCHISANPREAETSANVNKGWKTCAKSNDVITNVISANQHFASTFRCRYSNSREAVQALLPFPAPPPERPGELARRLCSLFWNALFSPVTNPPVFRPSSNPLRSCISSGLISRSLRYFTASSQDCRRLYSVVHFSSRWSCFPS